MRNRDKLGVHAPTWELLGVQLHPLHPLFLLHRTGVSARTQVIAISLA